MNRALDKAIKQALRRKSQARTAREQEQYDRALQHILDAQRQLEALWAEHGEAINEAGAAASNDERELVDALADIHGIRGGIYRSLKLYEDAVDAYDSGLGFEIHPTRDVASSYNLVQRLANRALLRPADIGAPGWEVKGVKMWDALRDAARKLGEQIAGERAQDPWAAADLVFVRLLLAPEASPAGEIEDAWRKLERLSPRPFVYESTRRALEDLQTAMGSVSPPRRSDGWKEVAAWVDRLIERFRAAEESAKAGAV